MPEFLRLQLTKPPPQIVYVSQPFPLTVTISDDLGSHVYFGASPLRLRLQLVDPNTYEIDTRFSLRLDRKDGICVPPSGNSYVKFNVTIEPALREKRKAQRIDITHVKLLLKVDEQELLKEVKSEKSWTQEVPDFVGFRGVYHSDAGEILPLPVYSAAIRISSAKAPTNTEVLKTQRCERHFVFSLGPECPVLRLPIQEHIHMTFSTGTHIWDCSPVLAQYLLHARERWIPEGEHVKVLELGAGCGLLGIVSAIVGGDVVVTDMEDTVQGILRDNVNEAQKLIKSSGKNGRLRALSLEWGILPVDTVTSVLEANPDESSRMLVLAADVLYNIGSHEVFLQTLVSIKASFNVDVLIGYKKRGPGEEHFFEMASEEFDVESVGKGWNVEIFWLRSR
ncbi:uncharacterized protein SPPG_02675 [Spizellomyces punctatus DAOM BR117]|uniref:Methyltransferase-domain-containing protein n=1 Tax=Spizellomyces punctatus (strain DAOM BR117) TaxID=645134 RepID=A0A0L0HM69_SPIPD|nr:uncharacterized protein SPPG_02675 [Spizellomyces punctatus DAOM BR117]KND02187.1 hypothetical protein SPPG_02675 [Spizellomyces punctatus DAOM BR117]|eukprot:XP_016610226.1 hypothetical protein SPPG_02675 [Spizellomyces punctatus DAOM BR117]